MPRAREVIRAMPAKIAITATIARSKVGLVASASDNRQVKAPSTATTAIQGTAITATKGTTAITKGTTATTKGIAPATTKGTATAITGHRKNARYRRDAANKWRLVQKLPLFEIALVLVRFDDASLIERA